MVAMEGDSYCPDLTRSLSLGHSKCFTISPPLSLSPSFPPAPPVCLSYYNFILRINHLLIKLLQYLPDEELRTIVSGDQLNKPSTF